jgi:hypothetical protein
MHACVLWLVQCWGLVCLSAPFPHTCAMWPLTNHLWLVQGSGLVLLGFACLAPETSNTEL